MTTYNIFYDTNGAINAVLDNSRVPQPLTDKNGVVILVNGKPTYRESWGGMSTLEIDNATYLSTMIAGPQNFTIINGALTKKGN